MRSTLTVAVAIFVALCAPASAQERFVHASSGASFPETFGDQHIRERRDLDSGNDSVVGYEADAGIESTTMYIFRAAVPDPGLWFDRSLPAVAADIPMALFDAGSVEPVTAFGSDAPNGVRQLFTARQAGPFRTTALVVARAGPWLVKVRATSASLDAAGLAARLDLHLDAVRLSLLTPPPIELAACPDAVADGRGRPIEPTPELLAAAMGAAAAARARLATVPSNLCRAHRDDRMTMLADRGTGGWVLLLGDAGKAIAVQPLSPDDKRYLVMTHTPAGLTGAGLFNGTPSAESAARAAATLLGPSSAGGLFTIGGSGDVP